MTKALPPAAETRPHPPESHLPNLRLQAVLAFALLHPLVHAGLYAFGGLVAYLLAQVFGTGFEPLTLPQLVLAGGMIAIGFFVFSGPPVLVATAIGFYVLRNRPAVRLRDVMLGTALLIVPGFLLYMLALGGVHAHLDGKSITALFDTALAAPIVALPGALIASYVTWNLTHRWHSPGGTR